MDKTTYELRPLLAEIRDGYRGMRAIRVSKRRRAGRWRHAQDPRARAGQLHHPARPAGPGSYPGPARRAGDCGDPRPAHPPRGLTGVSPCYSAADVSRAPLKTCELCQVT